MCAATSRNAHWIELGAAEIERPRTLFSVSGSHILRRIITHLEAIGTACFNFFLVPSRVCVIFWVSHYLRTRQRVQTKQSEKQAKQKQRSTAVKETKRKILLTCLTCFASSLSMEQRLNPSLVVTMSRKNKNKNDSTKERYEICSERCCFSGPALLC